MIDEPNRGIDLEKAGVKCYELVLQIRDELRKVISLDVPEKGQPKALAKAMALVSSMILGILVGTTPKKVAVEILKTISERLDFAYEQAKNSGIFGQGGEEDAKKGKPERE